MNPPRRLDQLMVERGLASSRHSAQALIMSGRVTVDGKRREKPGSRIASDALILVAGPDLPFVSRGGLKLAGALDALRVDVTGAMAVDIGASTGGFTDCLLQRGVSKVWAIDVGHGQLDWALRNDPRVQVQERLNARYLSPDDLAGLDRGADIAVIDVSFISLRLVLPRVPPLLSASGGTILALVKPQFEVGRGNVGRGGIIRKREDRRRVLVEMASFARSIGLSVKAIIRSPITGAEGNVEYFIHLTTLSGGLTPQEIEDHALSLTNQEQD